MFQRSSGKALDGTLQDGRWQEVIEDDVRKWVGFIELRREQGTCATGFVRVKGQVIVNW
ncbi:MAG: hypothetical protein LC137_14580 [Burkholderiales bacterium]|nr:hypothetical protein [Burkholderiales bacterium]